MAGKRQPARKPRAPAIEKRAGAYHHGNLRRALVDASLVLIDERGAAALSLREVARRAGVSIAAPYRHFESREALLAAIAEEGFLRLREQMCAAGEPHRGDPLARFREAGVAYVRFAVEHPAHYAVMQSLELIDKSSYPNLRQAAREAMQVLTDAVDACLAAELVAPGDPRELALAAWSAVHGLASLISTGQVAALGFDPTQVEETARFMSRSMLGTISRPRP